jgi:hypothetical protein
MGQTRKSGVAIATSDLSLKADIKRTPREVRKVPRTDIADASHAKKKPPEGGSLNSSLMIVDQAALNAGFASRRYAMKRTHPRCLSAGLKSP